MDKKQFYEAPSFEVIQVEVEQGIAATSIQVNQSWDDNSSSRDVEW